MARLPTVSGDTGTWGTVLNDYLTESASVMTLDSSPSVGATTFDLGVVPTGLRVGSVIAIDAYTTQCELRSVSGISESTITVAALKFDHASGDVVILVGARASIHLFGITGDGSDEWQPLQRLVIEALTTNRIVDGLRARIDIGQPLLFMESTQNERLWVRSDAGFAPVEDDGAMVMLGGNNSYLFFTAAASTNVFTTTGSHGLAAYDVTNHTKIAFNAPYGETLPGNVTAGQVYYVDTVPSATTFTVSATSGGAILDVSSDGSGNVTHSIQQLSRCYWESMRIDLAVANLNGLITNLQQPAWTRNMRIGMDAAASTSAIGWQLGGQISYHSNVEINTHSNCVGLQITGTGHNVYGFNDNGSYSDDTGIVIAGDIISVHDVWTENCGNAGIEISGTARGNTINGAWYFTSNDPTVTPALKVTSILTSYQVNGIRTVTGGCLFLDDTARGIQLLGESDGGHFCTGWTQHYGASLAPLLTARSFAHPSTDYTVTRQVEIVRVSTTGGTRTITIPTAVGWLGWTTTIKNAEGANNVIVDPVSSQTIDGDATVTLTPEQAITIYSDGNNYQIIGRVA